MTSDRAKVKLFGAVVRPLHAFLRLEAASAIALLLCAVIALVWANSSPLTYRALFEYPLHVGAGDTFARLTVRSLINDGLMAIFFFVVGMEILAIEAKLEDLQAPVQRFVHRLHPFVALLIMPLFALANSGVSCRGLGISDLATPVALGTAVGLFVGKQLGVFGLTFLAVKLRLAPMPGNAPVSKIYGASIVAGIGFTVALFIAQLAYRDTPELLDQAKIGILLGSFAAGLVGFVLLRLSGSSREAT